MTQKLEPQQTESPSSGRQEVARYIAMGLLIANVVVIGGVALLLGVEKERITPYSATIVCAGLLLSMIEAMLLTRLTAGRIPLLVTAFIFFSLRLLS